MMSLNGEAIIGSFSLAKEHLLKEIEQNYQEKGAEGVQLAPNWALVKQLEERGDHASIYLVDDDKLVGYCGVHFHRPLHYMLDIFAQIHVMYITKEYRGLRSFNKILDKVEEVCFEVGVSRLDFGFRHDDLEKILSRRNYTHTDTVYSLRI